MVTQVVGISNGGKSIIDTSEGNISQLIFTELEFWNLTFQEFLDTNLNLMPKSQNLNYQSITALIFSTMVLS